MEGLAGKDTLTAAAGDDLLIGGDGNDNLLGGDGADFLVGDAGNDTLDGGVALDRNFSTDGNIVSYGAAASGVNIDLSGIEGDGSTGSGVVTGDASVGIDILINVALILGSGFDDTIVGGMALILEQFEGGQGNDTIDGGTITDTLNADNTNRLVYLNAVGAGDTVDFAAGTAVGAEGSDVGNDTLANFNNVTSSRFDDTLLGSDRTDVPEYFQGGDGNDSIDGRGGYDQARYGNATGGITANLVTAWSPVSPRAPASAPIRC
ncbi:MAG: hypothetical protein IPO43_15405 [Rhodoferax sp.]|nr:hypothetical protein [Rhodoferax sp.]